MSDKAKVVNDAAKSMNELLIRCLQNEKTEGIDVNAVVNQRDRLREIANELEQQHTFEVGDYGRDKAEPTPSPEANTVRVVELTHQPANAWQTSDNHSKLVSEYKNNKPYSDESLVVGVKYPNMNSDEVWYMPEPRIIKE